MLFSHLLKLGLGLLLLFLPADLVLRIQPGWCQHNTVANTETHTAWPAWLSAMITPPGVKKGAHRVVDHRQLAVGLLDYLIVRLVVDVQHLRARGRR